MMNVAELKKFCLFNFIGALVIAALVAVVTVLIGEFNVITERVFWTLAMVVAHSLASLAFIWDDSKHSTFESLTLFANGVFAIIILSFFTTVFGIWKIIDGETVWYLYQTFFYVGFAGLHANFLAKALHKEHYLDTIVYANYVFILLVVTMIQPPIYIHNAERVLGPMYFRILAATGIIDGTLSILTMIFYKLFLHQHPQVAAAQASTAVQTAPQRRGLTVWGWLLIVFILVQMVIPFTFMMGRRLF